MLDDRQRTLYARHLLLAEIGTEEQAALCAATVHAPPGADTRATAVAREYLVRAGVTFSDEPRGVEAPVPSATEVDLLAGTPDLREAAAALAGAFAAVEAIKRITGVGRPGTLSLELA